MPPLVTQAEVPFWRADVLGTSSFGRDVLARP
jgi:hypothetical protein